MLSFFDRFEIRSIVSQRCLRARDKVTGMNVLVHSVSPDIDVVPLLRRNALLVCEGAQDGVEYAATPDRQELLDLTVWKSRQRVLPEIPATPVAAPKTEDKSREKRAGDFTMMFRVPNAARHRDDPSPAAQQESEPSTEAKAPAAQNLGEFTAMFQTPAASASPSPAAQQPAGNVGEFTAMFRAPEAPAPQPEPPPAAAAGPPEPAPSEFTAMFRAPEAPAPQPEPPPAVVPRPPEPGPAEFTSMFRAPEAPAPQPEPSPAVVPRPPEPGPGEFTSIMFRSPAPEQKPPEPVVSSPPPVPSGDDELTRLFQAPPPPSSAQPAPNSQDSAASEFTGLFQASQPPTPSASPTPPAGEFTALFQTPGSKPAMAPIPQRPATQPAAATDFDRFFNAPYANDPETEARLRGQAPVAPAAAPVRDAGEFTRLFGAKDLPSAPPAPAGATGAFAVPTGGFGESQPETPASGPSEYTRMFERPRTEAPPPAPAPSPAPAPVPVKSPSKFSGVLLYVVIGVLACAAIATVLFFALRH